MSDATTQEDTPADDFASGVETGDISAVAVVDMLPTFDDVSTAEQLGAEAQAWLASQQELVAPDVYTAMQETLDPLTDAVNDGIVPPSQARYFWFWLAYNAGVTLVPAAGIYAFVQGYVLKWAQQNGWATYGPNPVPTPAVQALIESANAASPLPGAANVPAVLPSPSQGQSTVGAAAREIVPSTIPATGLSPTAAAQVQAAIGVAAADVLKAQAAVIDAFLPNMAPGQVPEALGQQNTAINALEAQMGQVRAGRWPRGFTGLQEAVGGALEALHGAEQAINNLTEQMATKADSGLEDAITAVKDEVDATAAKVATIEGTTVPVLEGELGTLTGQVNQLADTVDNTVEPTLNQLQSQVEANTKKLALTDDQCLEDLCDTVQNVASPIKEGGATPDLLKTLGALLASGLALTTIIGMMDTLLAVLNIKTAVNGVVQDTETLTAWAEQAASVIEQQFSLAGWG